jgi:hypothetical protein
METTMSLVLLHEDEMGRGREWGRVVAMGI